MQVRITVGTGSDIPVWKSNIFYLKVDEAINATTTIPEEYAEWIDIANEKLNEIDNLDLDVNKEGTTSTVTITKKDGTTESVEINDGADGQDGRDGQDGQDGYTPQKGIDYFTEQDIEEMETDVKEDVLDEVYTKSETDTLLQEKADTEDIPDVSSFITKDVNNLTNYTLKTNTGSLIDLEINDTTYVVTLSLKDQDGTVISTDTIDLPLENVVVSGSYDETNKKIVLTLQSGDTVDIPVGALISGLQSEITSSNKLASDLVDDSNSGNKFVTTSEKTTWNGKYTKPSGGIPKTDLASEVQTSLGKADTALQSSDLTNYVTNTDYASNNTAGVIKLNASGYGTSIDPSGALRALVKTYEQYESSNSYYMIGKGTLENVITGKGLIDSSSDITGNASTSTTLKSFNYSRKGTNNTWAKVATASLVGTWEEKHAYLFVKGTHNSNFKQNGIISIDVIGNVTKSKVNSYSAQFISASTDLNVENFYIEYQDGDENTNATINFWVKNTTNTYASWQFKILQNTGWTIESADTSVTTLPTQYFTGKNAELNNISLKAINDKDGNDITTTYAKNTDYPTGSKAGVIKCYNSDGLTTNKGALITATKTYAQYNSGGNWIFIGKGTLENVITGKELDLKQLSTFDSTKTQVLKNINGTLTWVNE